MSKKQNNTSLVWFKNDLRTNDNTSLLKAIANSHKVIAIYVFDPKQFDTNQFGFKKTDKFRAQFLIETIKELKANLESLNISLFIYYKNTAKAINDLNQIFNFDAIFYQKEWTQEESDCISELKDNLPLYIDFIETYDQFLFHPEDIPYQLEEIPRVFTEFRKKCEKESSIRVLKKIEPVLPKANLVDNITSIPTIKDLGLEEFTTSTKTAFPFKGGENEALKRLENYFFETKKLGFYKKTRNGLIGTDYSSKFSAWLANGSISSKTIYWKIKEFEQNNFKNESTYWLVFELIWRDYFKYVSLKHGNKIFKIGGILNTDYSWETNPLKINKWINGQTKEPFVNANMLELKQTGWMSNRGRQNVASYFSKNLELDWRIGASYFESQLIDYDVHSNYGNWMYVSGVGNDPRNRTFNVKLQSERYDTSGKFQRLWLQETLF
jgi:deoxyribodipyrimidine photo-lyase